MQENEGRKKLMEFKKVLQISCPIPCCKAYLADECQIMVGREPSGKNGHKEWHLSISHPFRYPTWDEIHAARYCFMPEEITVAMILPPKAEYVNIHKNCFHLYELEP